MTVSVLHLWHISTGLRRISAALWTWFASFSMKEGLKRLFTQFSILTTENEGKPVCTDLSGQFPASSLSSSETFKLTSSKWHLIQNSHPSSGNTSTLNYCCQYYVTVELHVRRILGLFFIVPLKVLSIVSPKYISLDHHMSVETTLGRMMI